MSALYASLYDGLAESLAEAWRSNGVSFLNKDLLPLSILAVIPVILHFLLKNKPKKFVFPALRLLQARKKTNVHRLRLRHIWLLLLRIVAILVLVHALARPRLPPWNYTPNRGELFTLLGLMAAAIGMYYFVLRGWRRRRVSNHEFTSRRTMLRGGTGAIFALLFLLFVFLPYRNRLLAEVDAPSADAAANLPVTAVFLFDTSGSMAYTLENRTRLEAAREIADAHLKNLPPQSRVAIAQTGGSGDVVFLSELGGARNRIAALSVDALSRSTINDLLDTAIARQKADREETLAEQSGLAEDARRDHYLREIYVLTDLARSAWDRGATTRLREELEKLKWLQVYVIDVGVQQPANAAVTGLKLSRQTLPRGGDLVVEATLSASGLNDAERVVKLNVIGRGGKRTNKAQTTVKLGATPVLVPLTVQGLSGPYVQAEVRIDATDPLQQDDVRFFTVALHPPPRVLVVSDSRADANILMAALAPDHLPPGRARYRCDYLPATRLAETDLRRYESVCLLNVGRPREDDWKKLRAFVEAGGGLAVILGMPSRGGDIKLAYDAASARAVLPAELLRDLEFIPPEVLDLPDLSHPMLRKFEEFGRTGRLTSEPIRRFWRVRRRQRAGIVAHYSDARKSPAILERSVGKGRVVMLTTGISRGGWNDLPLADWEFVVFTDQLMQYLGGRAARNYNFEAGEAIRLRLDGDKPPRPSILRKPKAQVPILADPDGEQNPARGTVSLKIAATQADQVGNYQVIGEGAGSPLVAAFSLNAPASESDMTRMSPADLETLLGAGRFQIARDVDSLNRVVTYGRIGQEVFPLVLFCLIVVFAGEMFVANRFYESDQANV